MRLQNSPLLTGLRLQASADQPMHKQLTQSLIELITTGELKSGERMPSSRTLANDLGVSRNTVLSAFEFLTTNGYLESKGAAGSFVSAAYEKVRSPEPLTKPQLEAAPAGIPFSIEHKVPDLHFSGVLIDLMRRSERAIARVNRDSVELELKQVICRQLSLARGMSFQPEQLFLFNSRRQALFAAALIARSNGRHCWIEDPGSSHVKSVFTAAGMHVTPIGVDEQGICVEGHSEDENSPSLIYCTPLQQFPLGYSMSPKRRTDLLEFAKENDSLILEDDYSGWFSQARFPVAALQSMDANGSVIYAGNFEGLLSPLTRLAFLVVPEALIESFTIIRDAVDEPLMPSMMSAVSSFIKDGYMQALIRSMKSTYLRNREMLISRLSDLPRECRFLPSGAGTYVVLLLSNALDDTEISSALADIGIGATPLSKSYFEAESRSGLLLGYTADFDTLHEAAGVLRNALLEHIDESRNSVA